MSVGITGPMWAQPRQHCLPWSGHAPWRGRQMPSPQSMGRLALHFGLAVTLNGHPGLRGGGKG